VIQTDKGAFSGFNTLRKAYLDAFHGNPPIEKYFNVDEWSDKTLHISELGKCPRMQMLRLLGAPKKKRSEEATANDDLMFYQGNMIHALSVGACDWSGILVSYEQGLPGLPDGWSGHYDLIYDDRAAYTTPVRDFKTVRQNAFEWAYEWPKPEEQAQIRGYIRFLPDVEYGEVEHIDRGGANPPQVHRVDANNAWVDARIAQLNDWREQIDGAVWGPEVLDYLPPVLERNFKITYRKMPGELLHKWANIWYQNNWQCGWCDYLHGKENKKTGEWWIHPDSPCKPDMQPKVLIAKNIKGRLQLESGTESDRLALQTWLEGQLLEWTEEEVDVD